MNDLSKQLRDIQDAIDNPPDSTPRIYPKRLKRFRLLSYLTLIGGVVMLAGGIYEYTRTSTLKKSGKTVDGTLVDQTQSNTGKGRISYQIVVDYDPIEGRGYRKNFVVSKTAYDNAVAGKAIDVTYAPSDPSNSIIGREPRYQLEPFAMAAGFLLTGGALVWNNRWKINQVTAYVTQDA